MPTYEYACEACGHQLEVQQRIIEAPLKTCPACGKDALERLISATAFHLKGGGWYKDLYSSSKSGEGQKARTENDRADRLSKAIDDDKKKSSGGGGSSSSGSSSGSSSSGSSSSGSSSSGSSSSGGSSGGGGESKGAAAA